MNVVWDCGSEFKNLITDAEFNLVASRSAQAAVLRAIKAGETVVDLNKPEGDGTDSDGSGGSNGSPSTGSGTGTCTCSYALNISSANTDQGTVNDSVNKTYTGAAA